MNRQIAIAATLGALIGAGVLATMNHRELAQWTDEMRAVERNPTLLLSIDQSRFAMIGNTESIQRSQLENVTQVAIGALAIGGAMFVWQGS